MNQCPEDIITPRRCKSIVSSSSDSSSDYDKYLQLATEKNPVMLLELDSDGTIRYLSDLWETVVGPRESSQISDLILGTDDDKYVFHRAMEMMLINDSVSYTVTFNVIARRNSNDENENENENESECEHEDDNENENEGEDDDRDVNMEEIMTLEACGILVRDNETQLPTHSMWTVKPYDPEWYREETLVDLPTEFVKRLGFGATIFAEYLRTVDYEQYLDISDLPAPKMELCRVCENFVPAWWLETHAQSCVCEHRIDSWIHLLHDNLVEQAAILEHDPELKNGYKGLTVNTQSLACKNVIYCLKELCDISININPSELRSNNSIATTEDLLLNPISLTEDKVGGFYDFSPRSKWNIQNVKNWQLSFREQIDNDPGLALLVHETIDIAKQKVEALLRLDNAMTYSLRIKNEINNWVLQLISRRIENNKANLRLISEYSDSPSISAGTSIQSPSSQTLRQEVLIPSTALIGTGIVPSGTSSGKTSRNVSNNQNEHSIIQQHHNVNNETGCSNPGFGRKIASPQPHRPHSDLFSSPYLMTDSLPTPELPPLDTGADKSETEFPRRSVSSNSNISITHRVNRSHSRSLTPRQRNEDHNALSFSVSRNTSGGTLDSSDRLDNHSCSFPSIGPAKVTDLKAAAKVSKLKSTLSLTPGRNSPLPAALVNNQNSRKSSSTSQPKCGAENSGISSPNANSRDYLTPEQQPNSSNLPKQPLSPLLLATNQVKSPTPTIKDYTILKPISKGAYGSVYLARKKLTGEYFAIKVLRKSDMIAKNQVTNVKSERAIMMVQSEKPYVAPLYASFQNRDNLFLVMEYLPGGDLATLIKMMGYLPEEWTKQYISEVIIGVDDMHQNGIIHHDLKPENLLIDSKGHVKLTDFGLSRAGLVRRHKNINMSKSLSFSNISGGQNPITPVLGPGPGPGSGRGNHKRKSSLKHEFSESPSASSASTEEVSTRERGFSESSTQSYNDISALKRSDSQVSFSITNISRSNTPTPPLFDASHMRTNSNASDMMFDTGNPVDLALFHPDDSKQDKTFFGTPDYLAPETIEGTGEDDACDWWSVGCILFEMLLGYPPFHAKTPKEVFKNILAGNIEWPEFTSADDQKEFDMSRSKDLISKLLVEDPTKRLGYNGAEEIKEHPYFSDVDWERVYEEEPSFVPSVETPEDTDYFDLRGASIEDFGPDDDSHDTSAEVENGDLERDSQGSILPMSPNEVSKRSSGIAAVGQDNTLKTPINKLSPSATGTESHNNSTLSSPVMRQIPLAIPPHMRDRRVSKLNESQTEFGSFYYRNLSALDKANKDAINRLKNEHLTDSPTLHGRTSTSHLSSSSESSNSRIKPSKFSVSVCGSPGANLMGMTPITRAGSPVFRSSSPDRSISADLMGGLAKKGSRESSSSFPGCYSLPFNEDSPNSSRIKSPVSPSTSIHATGAGSVIPSLISSSSSVGQNRAKAIPRAGSQRTNSSEHGGSDRLQAISKVQSMRYRRRSGRRSVNEKDLRYHMDVLVCEPIPIHRYRISKELEDLGCSVVAVGTGDELIGRASSGIKFDLIMTALKLPEIEAADIVSLLKHTNGMNSTTPVVALTICYQEAVSVNLFSDVLERPVLSDSLRKIVAKYAFSKSQQQEETIFSDND